jgi:hypothetical protein
VLARMCMSAPLSELAEVMTDSIPGATFRKPMNKDVLLGRP